MTIKRIIYLFFILFIIISCNSNSSKNRQSNNIKKISLLQLGKHPVIDEVVDGFEHRVIELYGKNCILKKYNGGFDIATVSNLSRQMVASNSDLLVSVTTPASAQLAGVNRGKLPLVFTFVSNPVDIGYTEEGLKNTTGLSDKVDYEKTLQLIRNVLPKSQKIGYLITRSESNANEVLKGFKKYAPSYGFEIVVASITHPTDIRIATNSIASKVDLFLFGGDNNIASSIEVLINSSKENNKPTFACDEQSIKRGAIAGYSVDYYLMGKETADICKRILDGEVADSIEVKNFKSSKLIINMESVNKLGIQIDSSIINQAIVY